MEETLDLLTFEEVAEIFKVEVGTVKSWIQRKQLPDYVLWKLPGTRNGTIRVIKSRLEEWKKDGCLQA